MADFVHLHLHSQYSLLDGAIHLKKLFPALKTMGMDAVALTDHGYMYGTLDFYLRAKAENVHPILGCETYIARGSRLQKETRDNYHLVLLARNQQGLANLQYLVSMASLEGFYYSPRIDHDLLREHSAGLIGLSACLGGEIPRTYFASGYDAAKEMARKYAGTFDEKSFYLELQHNTLPEQDEINDVLIRISRETGIPLVATNDCHYLKREDARSQEILMAISQRKRLSDEGRLKHDVDEYYLKSPEEMIEAFSAVPEAIENTVRIASLCQVDIPNNRTAKTPIYFLPDFPTPENIDQSEWLRREAAAGLHRRFEEIERRNDYQIDRAVYEARLQLELDVIINMGFAGYFLIVADFINWAKDHKIPVGPGRGSGAGSLVAYSVRITDLDPLRYDLLFERFLNPERISMPDFDIDFCRNRRDEVLGYVRDKYGETRVGQIATFSTLKSRAVVRDVGRVLGFPLEQIDRIAKLVPTDPTDSKLTLEVGIAQEPRLREMAAEDPKVADLLETAIKLEGMYRHPGVHAAGVVIADKDIWNVVPAFRGRVDIKGESAMQIPMVTQYDKDMVELSGLVKFDFLGLDNLTKIADAERRINEDPERQGEPFSIDAIPLNDPAVFEMLSRGETGGVFQMEGEGFTRFLLRLKPDRFEDLIAAVALYRPGPLNGGMVDTYIECKHGRKPVEYLHPILEENLRETYGVIVYQEQVMQSARTMAGFSLGAADMMRRAMGKKKPEEMAKKRLEFMDGALAAHPGVVTQEQAQAVFEKIEFFSGYGFNKSHSATYALIGYQTAWLRCHWPVEFMAGILSCERSKPERVMRFLNIAKEMGLRVLPPDVNQSAEDFTIVRDANGQKVIRFGLSALKGVGEVAVSSMMQVRETDPFKSLWDVCERVDSRKVNKSVLETLIKAGAMDSLTELPPERGRPAMLGELENAMKVGQRVQKDKNSKQISLFEMIAADEMPAEPELKLPEVDPWSKMEMLNQEKDILGMYVSGHPLDTFLAAGKKEGIKREWTHTVGELDEIEAPADMEEDGRHQVYDVTTLGVISEVIDRRTKEGKQRYLQGEIDGMDGLLQFHIGSKNVERLEKKLALGEPLLFTGNMEISRDRDGNARKTFRLSEVERLTVARQKDVKFIQIDVDLHRAEPTILKGQWMDKLFQVGRAHPGQVQIVFRCTLPPRWESLVVVPVKVDLNHQVTSFLEQTFGERSVVFQRRKPKLAKSH
ncbi:DNA polymerase III subunit alpha [Myxococcota bacterium]|nr:DNA polymerase III subunit alpha [Myxococcota bacterium]MBU1410607.1 DNA polymerase III subunit alpha [Myxococcota bacterium]